jgi:hypothetical protein
MLCVRTIVNFSAQLSQKRNILRKKYPRRNIFDFFSSSGSSSWIARFSRVLESSLFTSAFSNALKIAHKIPTALFIAFKNYHLLNVGF